MVTRQTVLALSICVVEGGMFSKEAEDYREYAQRVYGVSYFFYPGTNRESCLYSLKRDPVYPKGNGYIVMSHLCEMADRHGTTLTLFCYNLNLVGYYAQFGFRMSRNTSFGPTFWMNRPPKQNRLLRR